jgi:hypothetical protein
VELHWPGLEPFEIVREVNLILGVIALIWLVFRRIRSSQLYAGHLRNDIWLLAFYWTAASVVGTFEQLFKTDTTSRTILQMCALVVTIRVLWKYNKDWTLQKRGEEIN